MENEQDQLKTVETALSADTGGFAYSAVAIIYLIVNVLLSIIVTSANISADSDLFLYLGYICAPVAICIAVFATVKIRKVPVLRLFPVKCKPKYFLIAVLLVVGLLFFLARTDEYVLEFLKLIGYKPKEINKYLPDLTGWKIVPAFLIIAIMPAVFEESLFRGVILNCCEDEAGSIRTIFLVGFCFALMHTSPEQTVYQFLAGSAFAFIAIKSGSILPSVLMHFLNNGLIIIFGACNLLDSAGNLCVPPAVDITLAVVGGVCLVGALCWLIFDKTQLKPYKQGTVKYFFLYASVGIIAFLLMWILNFIQIG